MHPNPIIGSDTPQTILVNGSGFVNKPSVTLSWTGVAQYPVPDAQVAFVNESQLQLTITTTTSPDNWTVKVSNPDGQASNVLAFSVVSGGGRTYSDDYPTAYRSADYNTPDPWDFYFRECTSFVAWRVNRDTATVAAPYFFSNRMRGGHWGPAEDWAANATALGIRVDQTPSVGAIAQWGVGELLSASGHVAYVENVNADGSVDVTEYNYHAVPNDHTFGYRLDKHPPRFIHVEAWPIYAASSSGMLYKVETSPKGSDTAIGAIRTASGTSPTITDIAVTPAGAIYAVSFTTLYGIDPQTAVATQIGSGLGQADVNALASAFTPPGSLFAAVQASSVNSVLATVAPGTGIATRVGSSTTDSGFANVYSLSAVGGVVYGLTSDGTGGGSLVRFDLISGHATLVRKIQFSAR